MKVRTAAPFAKMLRHLQQLKRALGDLNIEAVVDAAGGRHATLRVAGLGSDVTCRTNPQDAHSWYYWHEGKAFAAAGLPRDAKDAAEQVAGWTQALSDAAEAAR